MFYFSGTFTEDFQVGILSGGMFSQYITRTMPNRGEWLINVFNYGKTKAIDPRFGYHCCYRATWESNVVLKMRELT